MSEADIARKFASLTGKPPRTLARLTGWQVWPGVARHIHDALG